MRKFITILLFFIAYNIQAATYYVATTGNDSNPGTIGSPWKTWQKAFDTVVAGDTVYFRGGSYLPTTRAPGSSWPITRITGKYGTYTNPICFFAYPGEVPILDCRLIDNSGGLGKVGISMDYNDYLYFKGLIVQNVWQLVALDQIQYPGGEIDVNAIEIKGGGGHYTFENVTSRYNGGAGFFLTGFDTLKLINCDSYHNCDTLSSDPGNHSDGFWIMDGGAFNPLYFHRYTYIEGCRAWNCGDDGFDISSYKTVKAFNNWSWNHGWVDGVRSGEGNGWKFCQTYLPGSNAFQFHNNITAYNTRGIAHVNINDQNGFFNHRITNNSSYKDEYFYTSAGGGVSWYDPCAVAGGDSLWLRNNIAFQHTGYGGPVNFKTCDNLAFPDFVYHQYSTWIAAPTPETPGRTIANPAYTVTVDDFINLDSAQLRYPRQANGSLPVITFMKLVEGSDLINGGYNYGYGDDLGYAEYGEDNPVAVTSITVSGAGGATTISTDGGTLQMLASVLPEDATIKAVNWVCLPGSGMATINSSTGVLTAIADGAVLVIAESTDGSGVSGNMEVTISNQVVIPPPSTKTGPLKSLSGNALKSRNEKYLK